MRRNSPRNQSLGVLSLVKKPNIFNRNLEHFPCERFMENICQRFVWGGEVFKLWLIEPNLSTLQFFSVILIIYKVLFYGAVTVVNKKYKQNTANQMILGHV